MIPLRLYLYVAVVVAVLGGIWSYGHHQKQQGMAEVQARWDKAVAAQQLAQAKQDSEAAAESLRQFRNVERSRENDLRIQQARAVADAGARTELDRMRRALAAADSAAEQGRDAAAVVRANAAAKVARDLFGECASEYQAMAGEAGGLAAKVTSLQGYVNAVEGQNHASD
jgi:hypothetical protein